VVHTRALMADDDETGLGFGFYAKFAAIMVAIGIAVWVFVLIIAEAIYAWGILGMFLALTVVLLGIGWYVDRREAQRRSQLE
jgi:uncharacterized membrane protein